MTLLQKCFTSDSTCSTCSFRSHQSGPLVPVELAGPGRVGPKTRVLTMSIKCLMVHQDLLPTRLTSEEPVCTQHEVLQLMETWWADGHSGKDGFRVVNEGLLKICLKSWTCCCYPSLETSLENIYERGQRCFGRVPASLLWLGPPRTSLWSQAGLSNLHT